MYNSPIHVLCALNNPSHTYTQKWTKAMAFIPIPNTMGVRAVFSALGETFTNNYYFEGDATWSATDMATVLTTLEGIYNTNYGPSASTLFSLIELIGRDMSTQFGPIVSNVITPPIAGLDPGAPLPLNCALSVTLRTGLAGRSFRGRIYHAGLTEGATTGNDVSPTYVTNVGTLYAAINSITGPNNPRLVVASRYSGGLPRVTGVTTPVTAIQVNSQVDTQRRRLP